MKRARNSDTGLRALERAAIASRGDPTAALAYTVAALRAGERDQVRALELTVRHCLDTFRAGHDGGGVFRADRIEGMLNLTAAHMASMGQPVNVEPGFPLIGMFTLSYAVPRRPTSLWGCVVALSGGVEVAVGFAWGREEAMRGAQSAGYAAQTVEGLSSRGNPFDEVPVPELVELGMTRTNLPAVHPRDTSRSAIGVFLDRFSLPSPWNAESHPGPTDTFWVRALLPIADAWYQQRFAGVTGSARDRLDTIVGGLRGTHRTPGRGW